MERGVFTEAIDDLVALGPSAFGDAASIVALERDLSRLEAFVTAAVASFDTSGSWADDGARNPSSWLVARCRLPKALARRQVRLGRELRFLPACARSWSDGEISGSHVEAIAGLRHSATEAALSRDEELLVNQARTLSFASFARAVAYWSQLADPDGNEESAEERRARRKFVAFAIALTSNLVAVVTGQPHRIRRYAAASLRRYALARTMRRTASH